ncbi:DinB family protein [Stratiformator vulcanicus]|uniref:DinB superfamily protein n=1 Tax=Stratiformator vulcanicus TaxID=2527980 RepID=A0A517R3K8_9PLAN|nr:DinB family protein [Stratiformator vulcanicus]QDT38454.1 DinB superfamily protein [Stratiformator vulcanicus]
MTTIETIKAALELCYNWTHRLAADCKDIALTFPTPNGGNHPMWVVGHAAHASAGLLSLIDGRPNPYAEWDAIFQGGTQPVADPTKYPPYEEVLAAYEASHRALIEYVDSIDESKLDDPPAVVMEAFADNPDFKTIGRLLLFIAMHDMSHRGQLADARRAAGRGPLDF